MKNRGQVRDCWWKASASDGRGRASITTTERTRNNTTNNTHLQQHTGLVAARIPQQGLWLDVPGRSKLPTRHFTFGAAIDEKIANGIVRVVDERKQMWHDLFGRDPRTLRGQV
jgi:hypothetical protein